MVYLLEQLFLVIWREETIPKQWREHFIKKGDKKDPGNYRGITLLSVVGKVFCKILLVQCLDKGGALHGGLTGFRSCMDNVYTLNEIVQGRIKKCICFLFRCTESVQCCVARWSVVKTVGHGCKGEDVACN